MAKPVHHELRKAYKELQGKIIENTKKMQIIDSQIGMLKRFLANVDITQAEITKLPRGMKTYEAVGRMFIYEQLEDVKKNLKCRAMQLSARTTELENNKQYLEKNLKEYEDNISEMDSSGKNK